MIEAVYGPEVFERVPKGLQSVMDSQTGQRQAAVSVAWNNALTLSAGYSLAGGELGNWASEAHTPTRLGEPTATLHLLRWADGVLVDRTAGTTPRATLVRPGRALLQHHRRGGAVVAQAGHQDRRRQQQHLGLGVGDGLAMLSCENLGQLVVVALQQLNDVIAEICLDEVADLITQANLSQDAWYWRFVEFGTRKMRARPFLRPALEAKRREAVQAMKDRLSERIELEAKDLYRGQQRK